MPQQENNSKMEVYFQTVLYVGSASLDVTTNITRRMAALTGDATARLKAIIVSAGGKN
jgi:hypothetical protein